MYDIYYTITVIKTVWNLWANRETDKLNKIESPEKDSITWGNLWHSNSVEGKPDYLIEHTVKTVHSSQKKVRSLPHSLQQKYFGYIKDLTGNKWKHQQNKTINNYKRKKYFTRWKAQISLNKK